MCGIIGALANRPAAPLLLDALRRLEYRGYDSAGVATLDEQGRVQRRRAVGKLAALSALLDADPIPGRIGIGHTRWATHGAPTVENAHPHRAGPVAVVHNGIVENWRALKEGLGDIPFESETDTEVVAQLCAAEMARGLSPVDAAQATVAQLRGAFALCFLFEGADDLLVCARRGSPLAIGYGEGEMFVGSDALALAPFTGRIAYLQDGDVAAVARDGARIVDADGAPVRRPVRTLALDNAIVGKDGHRHFMAKEIHEQPGVVGFAAAAHAPTGGRRGRTPAEKIEWERLTRLGMVACGTAHYACQVSKYWFERLARLPVDADVASEFRYRDPALPPGGAVLLVSQSGETADTLAALRHARAADQTVIAVVNVDTSSIAREADVALPVHAGPEIAVASTKGFTAQLTTLAALALRAGLRRGALEPPEAARLSAALTAAPGPMAAAIALEPAIAAIAAEIATARSVLYIGRGPMHPLALEAALKLKELTYVHAEGLAAGELKHGPIALVDEATPVVAFAPSDPFFQKTLSNLQEVMARKGRIVLVTDAEGAAAAGPGFWRTLVLPSVDPFVAPIVYATAAQLLAYHAAVFKGTDVDQPRNLAKSVTVE
jgi:glucosamine--fructose-6-phosphate aminotransferase (isomerizing)